MDKRKAFTMVEILLALFVLTSSIYVLSGLQTRSLFRLLKDQDDLEKLFFIKERLYQVFFTPINDIKPKKEKSEIDELMFTRNFIEIGPKSALRDFNKIIQLVYVEALWKHDNIKRKNTMVTIIGKSDSE